NYSGDNVVRADVHGDAGIASCQSTPPIGRLPFATIEMGRRHRVRTWELRPYDVAVGDRSVEALTCKEVESAATGGPGAAGAPPAAAAGGGPGAAVPPTAAAGAARCAHDPCGTGFALAADCAPE